VIESTDQKILDVFILAINFTQIYVPQFIPERLCPLVFSNLPTYPKFYAREGCSAGQDAIITWYTTKKPLPKVFRERGM
jgi:hypothetical protein